LQSIPTTTETPNREPGGLARLRRELEALRRFERAYGTPVGRRLLRAAAAHGAEARPLFERPEPTPPARIVLTALSQLAIGRQAPPTLEAVRGYCELAFLPPRFALWLCPRVAVAWEVLTDAP